MDGELDLQGILWERLGPQAEDDAATRGGLEALRRITSRRRARRRRRRTQALDPDLVPLLDLIAVSPNDIPEFPDLTAMLRRGESNSIPRAAVPEIFQAYVRAIGRIVSAEAEVTRELVSQARDGERAEVLEQALDDLVVVGGRGFDLLHRILLLDALAEALTDIDGEEDEGLAVAMVDLVSSTRHLVRTEEQELEHLVDALFQAGQLATASRHASVVKYVGDGLFLSGRDVLDVADAALDVIARLEEALPLRARGGLAHGIVLRRAGDLFGLPINTAHIVTKAARPGTLLATAAAAEQLPRERRARPREVDLPHPALGRQRVATVRPAS